MRAAFSYLVDKGLVLRRRGQGTIVTKGKVSRSVKLTSLFDDLADAGKRPTTRVLHNEVVKASDLVKEALGLDEDQLVLYLERLRFGEDEPIALMHNYIPTSLVTLSNDMLEVHGLYELLRASGIHPARAVQRISAKNASAAEARLVGRAAGDGARHDGADHLSRTTGGRSSSPSTSIAPRATRLFSTLTSDGPGPADRVSLIAVIDKRSR